MIIWDFSRRRTPITLSEAATISAVTIAGVVASVFVSPALIITTLIIAALLTRAARRAAFARGEEPDDFGDFPPAVLSTLNATLAQLIEGDARRLLLTVALQARPIFAKTREPLLDEQAEGATRQNAGALLEASCDTALELARLDSIAAGDAAGAARSELAARLTSAASAFNSLYLAGFAHGSSASNRVAELVEEISADSKARSAAASEMGELLNDGTREVVQ